MKVEVNGASITLSELFCEIEIKTEDGHRFGISQRDTGLEIMCPDGTLVGVKVGEDGKTFVERDCKMIK